jgi:hypothetical protein
MTRAQFSGISSRQSVEAAENVEKRHAALGLYAKSATVTLGAAFVVATTLLAVGCAEEVEKKSEQTLKPKPEIRAVRQTPPSKDPPVDGQEFRLQKKRDWWNHAREMLFAGIDLNAEQAHAVDAIIEAQLNTRARVQQLDAQVTASRKTQDKKRIKAAREEFQAVSKQIKEPHEIYEEMRAVLAKEQRPAFDMNRARHVAAMQRSGRTRPKERAEQADQE